MYNRLHKLHLCVSHRDVLKTLDKLGEGFDGKVMQWRDKLMSRVQQNPSVSGYSHTRNTLKVLNLFDSVNCSIVLWFAHLM